MLIFKLCIPHLITNEINNHAYTREITSECAIQEFHLFNPLYHVTLPEGFVLVFYKHSFLVRVTQAVVLSTVMHVMMGITINTEG